VGVAARLRALARALALVAVWLGVVLLGLELALRVHPAAIPLGALLEFEPALRSEIAVRRNLPRKEDTRLVPRSDGGPPRRMWVYEPGVELSWQFDEPGVAATTRMDGAGFCNAPADAWRRAHFDVIAVGDSFTFCTAVAPEATWPARLAALSGRSVYDLGLPGRGLHEYLEALRGFGLEKSPAVVVMNVYEGNDLRDAYTFHQASAQADPRLADSLCPFPPALCRLREAVVLHPFLGRSYALNFVFGWLSHQTRELQESAIDFRYDVAFPQGQTVAFNPQNGDRGEVRSARLVSEGRLGPELFDDALETYRALADEHGFVPVLTYTPAAYTTYAGRTNFRDPANAALLAELSRVQREYFARRAGELGLPYLDLTPALRQAARDAGPDERLYFRTNLHLSPRGHAAVARAIAGLLDTLPPG
jgi:hypothetical protein